MSQTPPDYPISSRLPPPPGGRYKVLVTGATGYIASQLLPAFRQRYDLVLLDVRTTNRSGQTVDGAQVANLLADGWEALTRHFAGVDAVVHLGYYRPPNTGVTGAGKGYLDERPNVDMAQHVYQLSQEAGVKRVVVASSNHAADWYEPLVHARSIDQVTPADLPKSDNFYGWAKVAYEALGFAYASGGVGPRLANVQIRIGAPREIQGRGHEGQPEAYKRNLGAFISPRDLQQLFVRSIETAHIEDEWNVPFQIFYGISNNTRAFWSIANARRIIGYDPEDDSETRYPDDIRRLLGGNNGRVGVDRA